MCLSALTKQKASLTSTAFSATPSNFRNSLSTYMF
jgi:hypothetical protein